MKAAVLEDIEKLTFKDVNKPEVHPGGILIKVKACGICGSDLKLFHHGNPKITLPQIIGHEFAGVVVAVGDGVTQFTPGDRITSATSLGCGKCDLCTQGFTNLCDNISPISWDYPGGFAEYMEIPEKAVRGGYTFKIPDSVPDESAAISELLACVINGQIQAQVGNGDIVLIIGAGPAGCLHCEVAKARGAKKIILSGRSGERLRMARRFNIDILVNVTEENLMERILEETEGKGVDVVIVAAPSPEAMEESLKMVKKRGRINFFASIPKGSHLVALDTRLIHYRELSISGVWGSTAAHHQTALDLLTNEKINTKDLITHQLPLKDIVKGFEIVESRKALKVIIRPG